MTRRLFFAIEFPDDVKQRLAQAACQLSGLARQGRWTRPENLHLTLQFLGDCPDEWLPDLLAILRQSVVSCPPFELKIAGCGTFGHHRDILWLGVQAGPRLGQLVDDLASLLQQWQLPYEERPYSPHITIGRQVRIGQEVISSWVWEPINLQVTRISLMESSRVHDLLTYLPVQQMQLQGNNEHDNT